MALGSKIREYRTKLNVTQEELGKLLHVSRQTISNWEVGRSYPDIESLILLSDIFNLSLDKLSREDTKMVSSLKKRKISEVIYISFIVCLIIGAGISVLVDLIINRQLTWSLIVLSSCLLAGGFLSVFKYTSTYHLIKASSVSSVFLFILFLSINNYVKSLDFQILLVLGTLWFLFYMVNVFLIEVSKLSFWNLLIIILAFNFPIEIITKLMINENLFSFVNILSNIPELFLLVVLILVSITNLDKGKMTVFLTNYREYTQTKR